MLLVLQSKIQRFLEEDGLFGPNVNNMQNNFVNFVQVLPSFFPVLRILELEARTL